MGRNEAKIKISNEVNIKKWPITFDVNGDETMTFDQSIERMRKEYNDRIKDIDKYISEL